MPKRRIFSAEFKAKIVLDLLSGAKNAAELCREHDKSRLAFSLEEPISGQRCQGV